jgi:N-methylhydantoinase A
VLATHGADPRELAMIAYGGNGAVHAWAQALELGIGRILVPKAAPAFSALGLLVADYLVDLVRAYVVPLSQVDIGRVVALMKELFDEAAKELAPANLSPDQQSFELFVQMCYPGQNFDMSVPVPEGVKLDATGLLDLAGRFHDQHEAQRGFAFRGQQPLIRGVRLAAGGRTPKPPTLASMGTVTDVATARRGERPAFFGSAFVDTPVYDGSVLGPGAVVDGPALIEEAFTVVVLPPGQSARLDDNGNYDITVA